MSLPQLQQVSSQVTDDHQLPGVGVLAVEPAGVSTAGESPDDIGDGAMTRLWCSSPAGPLEPLLHLAVRAVTMLPSLQPPRLSLSLG